MNNIQEIFEHALRGEIPFMDDEQEQLSAMPLHAVARAANPEIELGEIAETGAILTKKQRARRRKLRQKAKKLAAKRDMPYEQAVSLIAERRRNEARIRAKEKAAEGMKGPKTADIYTKVAKDSSGFPEFQLDSNILRNADEDLYRGELGCELGCETGDFEIYQDLYEFNKGVGPTTLEELYSRDISPSELLNALSENWDLIPDNEKSIAMVFLEKAFKDIGIHPDDAKDTARKPYKMGLLARILTFPVRVSLWPFKLIYKELAKLPIIGALIFRTKEAASAAVEKTDEYIRQFGKEEDKPSSDTQAATKDTQTGAKKVTIEQALKSVNSVPGPPLLDLSKLNIDDARTEKNIGDILNSYDDGSASVGEVLDSIKEYMTLEGAGTGPILKINLGRMLSMALGLKSQDEESIPQTSDEIQADRDQGFGDLVEYGSMLADDAFVDEQDFGDPFDEIPHVPGGIGDDIIIDEELGNLFSMIGSEMGDMKSLWAAVKKKVQDIWSSIGKRKYIRHDVYDGRRLNDSEELLFKVISPVVDDFTITFPSKNHRKLLKSMLLATTYYELRCKNQPIQEKVTTIEGITYGKTTQSMGPFQYTKRTAERVYGRFSTIPGKGHYGDWIYKKQYLPIIPKYITDHNDKYDGKVAGDIEVEKGMLNNYIALQYPYVKHGNAFLYSTSPNVPPTIVKEKLYSKIKTPSIQQKYADALAEIFKKLIWTGNRTIDEFLNFFYMTRAGQDPKSWAAWIVNEVVANRVPSMFITHANRFSSLT